jgi:hypothetical protein
VRVLLPLRLHIVIAAICALLDGCTLVSDFEVNACQLDADCDVLGDAAMFCEDARCEPGCRDNHQCLERDPRYPLCQHKGGECVAITGGDGACYVGSPYDDATLGPLTLEQMSTLGAFSSQVASSTWLSLELAAREMKESGALPSADGVGRPLLVSLCDDDPETMDGATHHLFEELGARAIVASLGDDALRVALSHPAAPGALWLSPFTAVTSAEDEGPPLARYLQGSYVDVAPVYSTLSQRIADLRAARQPAAAPLRVAVLSSDASEDDALGTRIFETLALNDLDATTLRRLGQLEKFQLPARDRLARAEVIDALVEHGPDLVLILAGGAYSGQPQVSRASELVELFADRERLMPSPPVYVWGPRNATDAGLLQALLANTAIMARSIGVDLRRAGAEQLSVALDDRFRTAFPEALTPIDASVYDAFYFLAYAIAAAPPGPDAVAAGFARISSADGEALAVGPGADGIDRAKVLLSEPGPIRTEGVTGPAEFDSVTGVRWAAPRVYCWGPGASLDGVRTVARFVDGQLDLGTGDCGAGLIDAP